jgi:hypothetical protein
VTALLKTVLAALALCAAVVLPAGVAGADSLPAVIVGGPSAATPTDSATPPGPKDPGTGESPEAKETRVDYAPYVIAAVLVIALGAAAVIWRRAGGGPSSKSARGSTTDPGDHR